MHGMSKRTGVTEIGHVTITVLVENTTERRGLLAEHGLAVLVEARGRRILFDTGAGRALLPNAEALGVNLDSVSAVVLSHGHYDHTGGLKAFLEAHGPVDVYAHPDVFRERYSVKAGEEMRSVGILWKRRQLERWGARFNLKRTTVMLGPGLFLTGAIPRLTEYEKNSEEFKTRSGSSWEEDIIPDDQALVIHSSRGLIVLLGCAHAGLINTLRHVRLITGVTKIHAVFGGTHLKGANIERVNRTIEALDELGVDLIAAGHCTGFEACAALYRELGKRFHCMPVGTVFTVN